MNVSYHIHIGLHDSATVHALLSRTPCRKRWRIDRTHIQQRQLTLILLIQFPITINLFDVIYLVPLLHMNTHYDDAGDHFQLQISAVYTLFWNNISYHHPLSVQNEVKLPTHKMLIASLPTSKLHVKDFNTLSGLIYCMATLKQCIATLLTVLDLAHTLCITTACMVHVYNLFVNLSIICS